MKKIIIFLLFVIGIISFPTDFVLSENEIFDFTLKDEMKKRSKDNKKTYSMEEKEEKFANPMRVEKIPLDSINFNKNQKDMKIVRKKYIDFSHWNIGKVSISDKVIISKVKEIKTINNVLYEDIEIKKDGIILSDEAIKSIIEDDIDTGKEEITSKKNIVLNQKTNFQIPKIVLYNNKIILKNPVIYEVTYKGYKFRIIGDKKLYKNKEIKSFIKYMKDLEIYF